MKIKNKYIYIYILIISSILDAQNNAELKDYFSESSGRILSNNSNQFILGSAALAAFASTKIDQKIKVYAQGKGLLPEKVSHFGDMYGGYWAHWIIWSSILGTSISNKEKNNFSEKLEFSTLAMITNGVITELMKRSFGRVRPNGGCCISFPSGHTGVAFALAMALYCELTFSENPNVFEIKINQDCALHSKSSELILIRISIGEKQLQPGWTLLRRERKGKERKLK